MVMARARARSRAMAGEGESEARARANARARASARVHNIYGVGGGQGGEGEGEGQCTGEERCEHATNCVQARSARERRGGGMPVAREGKHRTARTRAATTASQDGLSG